MTDVVGSICPICKKKLDGESAARPFCSERCRLIDLGNWLGDGYKIPGEPADDESPASAPRSADDDD